MTYRDKNDLIAKRLKVGFLSIELGVGQKKFDATSIGVDVIDGPACDVVGDAIEVLGSLPDSCVESVYASHFIEHIESVHELLSSLVRVCIKGAKIIIIAPHFSNPFFYNDPTHKATYGLYTFAYYAQSSLFRRTIPSYSRINGLVLIGATIYFSSYPPNYVRHGIKKIAQYVVNSSGWTQEFYEEALCWLFPCYEVKYELTIAK